MINDQLIVGDVQCYISLSYMWMNRDIVANKDDLWRLQRIVGSKIELAERYRNEGRSELTVDRCLILCVPLQSELLTHLELELLSLLEHVFRERGRGSRQMHRCMNGNIVSGNRQGGTDFVIYGAHFSAWYLV